MLLSEKVIWTSEFETSSKYHQLTSATIFLDSTYTTEPDSNTVKNCRPRALLRGRSKCRVEYWSGDRESYLLQKLKVKRAENLRLARGKEGAYCVQTGTALHTEMNCPKDSQQIIIVTGSSTVHYVRHVVLLLPLLWLQGRAVQRQHALHQGQKTGRRRKMI